MFEVLKFVMKFYLVILGLNFALAGRLVYLYIKSNRQEEE